MPKAKPKQTNNWRTPSWDKPLTNEDIKYCENNYGFLAKDFRELADLIKQADELFSEQLSDNKIPTVKISVVCYFPTEIFLTPETIAPALQIFYSVRRLKPEIERTAGVSFAETFYYQVVNCFQFDPPFDLKDHWWYKGAGINRRRTGHKISGVGEILEYLEQWHIQKLLSEASVKAGEKEQNNPIWTKPLGLKKWAEAFGVSQSTMRRWFKDKKYENKKISDRKWSILYKDLPAEVVARVKNRAS